MDTVFRYETRESSRGMYAVVQFTPSSKKGIEVARGNTRYKALRLAAKRLKGK